MGLFTKAVTSLFRGASLTDHALVPYLGGNGDISDAGERVSVDGSLQIGTVWACVRLISRTIATLPLVVYKEGTGGHGKPDSKHPLYDLLHYQPNLEMTAVEFWEAVIGNLLLWGNGYVRIMRQGRRVVALYPLQSERLTVKRNRDGSISYTYVDVLGNTSNFRETDLLHIKGFSLDGLCGLSPVAQARNTLGAAKAAERASSAMFANGMRPSGQMVAPTYLTPEQREQAHVMLTNFTGAGARGKVPLVEGGWKFEPLSIPPEDAQLLETRSFHVEEICRWFDVPPVMIGHSDKATTWGSGVEQIMLHFYKSCLRSHLKRIEMAIYSSLLREDEREEGYYVEFVIEGLLRADSGARASFYSTMVQNGLMSRNEVRKLENLPAVPDGDELTVQTNLTTLEKIGAAEPEPSQRITAPQNGQSMPIPEIQQ